MKKAEMKFRIGDWVSVASTLTRTKRWDSGCSRYRVRWEDTRETPFFAVVTGAGCVYDGDVTPGSYDESSYFGIEKRIPVYFIRRGMMNKEIPVLESRLLKYVLAPEAGTIPRLHLSRCSWSEEAKESLRKEMKAWPRDVRGRWTKYAPV